MHVPQTDGGKDRLMDPFVIEDSNAWLPGLEFKQHSDSMVVGENKEIM